MSFLTIRHGVNVRPYRWRGQREQRWSSSVKRLASRELLQQGDGILRLRQPLHLVAHLRRTRTVASVAKHLQHRLPNPFRRALVGDNDLADAEGCTAVRIPALV